MVVYEQMLGVMKKRNKTLVLHVHVYGLPHKLCYNIVDTKEKSCHHRNTHL